MDEKLLQRIERLESLDEIRQLVAKYSLSLDMRDLDAHVNLFAPDIRVSRELSGRANLKVWVDDTLRKQIHRHLSPCGQPHYRVRRSGSRRRRTVLKERTRVWCRVGHHADAVLG